MTIRYELQVILWNIVLLVLNISSVNCQLNTAQKTINNVRLSGGSYPNEGNVEVTTDQNGEFFTLCDDSFRLVEANVVCNHLGFERAIRFTRSNHFGKSMRRSSDAWRSMYNLDCQSVNDTIRDCEVTDNEQEMCTSNEVAGVVCQSDLFNTSCPIREFACEMLGCIRENWVCDGDEDCIDGSDETLELCNEGLIRLQSNAVINVPGRSAAGTVNVKFDGRWGTVCDDNFDKKEAQVICRQLGYGGGISIPLLRAYFGQGNGSIFVDESRCLGTEKTLRECSDIIWGKSDCTHREDAGVFCHEGNLQVQLVDGSTADSGRVEITIVGSIASSAAICDKGFDDLDAQVVCRMLGYDPTGAAAHRGSHFGRGSGTMWNIILDCIGHENSIEDCRMRVNNDTCTHSNTAAVTCVRRQRSVEDLLSQVLPADCGEPVDSSSRFITGFGKIRGGTVPSMFDAPWLASLRLRKPNRGYSHECGAVIISEDYLLSVAHCFETEGKLHYVVSVGSFNSRQDESSQEEFFIDKLWNHENFEEIAFADNDITLIKIERKNGRGIRLGPRVKAVCLPKIGDTYADLASCSVAGWGRTDIFSDHTTLPRVAESQIIGDETCEGFYSSKRFTSSMTCFRGAELFVNPCKGDSGGPLTCKVGGRHVLYGLVSSGELCGSASLPDIYTRVTKFLRWIQEKIARDTL